LPILLRKARVAVRLRLCMIVLKKSVREHAMKIIDAQVHVWSKTVPPPLVADVTCMPAATVNARRSSTKNCHG
jgi:hypothetical protein